MPKKTKQQKILARMHRQTQLSIDANASSSEISYQFNPMITVKSQPLSTSQLINNQAIFRDLSKTIILSVIAIAIELTLFISQKSFR